MCGRPATPRRARSYWQPVSIPPWKRCLPRPAAHCPFSWASCCNAADSLRANAGLLSPGSDAGLTSSPSARFRRRCWCRRRGHREKMAHLEKGLVRVEALSPSKDGLGGRSSVPSVRSSAGGRMKIEVEPSASTSARSTRRRGSAAGRCTPSGSLRPIQHQIGARSDGRQAAPGLTSAIACRPRADAPTRISALADVDEQARAISPHKCGGSSGLAVAPSTDMATPMSQARHAIQRAHCVLNARHRRRRLQEVPPQKVRPASVPRLAYVDQRGDPGWSWRPTLGASPAAGGARWSASWRCRAAIRWYGDQVRKKNPGSKFRSLEERARGQRSRQVSGVSAAQKP